MSTFGYGLTKHKYATHEIALKAIADRQKKIERLLKHQNELKTWTPDWAIKRNASHELNKLQARLKKKKKQKYRKSQPKQRSKKLL